jgi:hypothetical protein
LKFFFLKCLYDCSPPISSFPTADFLDFVGALSLNKSCSCFFSLYTAGIYILKKKKNLRLFIKRKKKKRKKKRLYIKMGKTYTFLEFIESIGQL